jgi:hypothetical protein
MAKAARAPEEAEMTFLSALSQRGNQHMENWNKNQIVFSKRGNVVFLACRLRIASGNDN